MQIKTKSMHIMYLIAFLMYLTVKNKHINNKNYMIYGSKIKFNKNKTPNKIFENEPVRINKN